MVYFFQAGVLFNMENATFSREYDVLCTGLNNEVVQQIDKYEVGELGMVDGIYLPWP